jgi:Holliday junction DNA helicase RuvA
MDLYGFLQNDEHELFNLLLSVNGIGPKQSLKILGFNDVGDIVKAIISEDSGYLESLPGIGKKKAQQIILELKEKARKNFDMAAIPLSSHNIEAIAALESLGFSPKEARSAVEKALATEGVKTGDVGTIVESALKLLS